MLTMVATFYDGDGRPLGTNPVRYEVKGLPDGLTADIHLNGGVWHMERSDRDDDDGPFDSAEAALSALQAEFSN
jgi:hypothetical protein